MKAAVRFGVAGIMLAGCGGSVALPDSPAPPPVVDAGRQATPTSPASPPVVDAGVQATPTPPAEDAGASVFCEACEPGNTTAKPAPYCVVWGPPDASAFPCAKDPGTCGAAAYKCVSPQATPPFDQSPDGGLTAPACGPGYGVVFIDYSPYDNYVDELWCARCPTIAGSPYCAGG
jgi:hypothetical protein